MLQYFAKLPVKSEEFAYALEHNFDLMATIKKLKNFDSLTLLYNAILIKNLAEITASPVEGIQVQLEKLLQNKQLANLKTNDYLRGLRPS